MTEPQTEPKAALLVMKLGLIGELVRKTGVAWEAKEKVKGWEVCFECKSDGFQWITNEISFTHVMLRLNHDDYNGFLEEILSMAREVLHEWELWRTEWSSGGRNETPKPFP